MNIKVKVAEIRSPTTIDQYGVKTNEAGDGPPPLHLHAGGGFRTAHPAMPLLVERHLLSMVQAGHLSHEDTCKSLRLMATKLYPRLKELGKLTSIAAA